MSKEGDRTEAAARKATLVLSIQEGFKDVTMKDICEAAGPSRDELYTYCGNTGQVFADIVNELVSGLKSQVAEKIERDLPAALILDELLERYQSEMLDRNGSLGLAFYEYYSNTSLSEDNAMLKQYYISKTIFCSLIKYGTDKGEFKQTNVNAVMDLLPFSYQDIRMLDSVMSLDDGNIPKDMISEIRTILVE